MNRQAVNEKETQVKTRLSVSLPPELHQELKRIARDKKVSPVRVMREAAEKYVASQWPLLTQFK